MRKLLLLSLLVASAHVHAMRIFCDAEVVAQERATLSDKQRSRLEFYKGFNESIPFRIKVGYAAAYAHRDPSSRHNEIDADNSPVSACLLKTLADGNDEKEIAPFAQEGYALRLLAGAGVPHDRATAIEYLTRAAERWRYGSAAVRLARLCLEDAPAPGAVERAMRFARLALDSNRTTPAGSVPPSDARQILFDIYLSGRYGPKNLAAAKEFYIEMAELGYDDSVMAEIGRRHPDFPKQVRERAGDRAAGEAAAASDRCFQRQQAYDRCRIRAGGGMGATLRACGPSPTC